MSIGQTLESGNMRQMIRERDDALARLEGRGVTVVVPCFNQGKYLAESIPSALWQTVRPLEIIVVDDGSTENIADSLWPLVPSSEEEPHVRVQLIRVANRGLPSARNVGLMNAHGHAILPLDADDWLEPTYIEKTLPLLDAGADVVFTGLQEHGERNGTYVPGCDVPLAELTVEQERMSNRLFYCALIRSETLRNAGGWNGRMVHGYEDWDLWVDLMQRGAKLAAVNEPLFNYRTRRDGMLAQTETEWREWCLDEMARHHGYERPQSARQIAADRRTQLAHQRAARRRSR